MTDYSDIMAEYGRRLLEIGAEYDARIKVITGKYKKAEKPLTAERRRASAEFERTVVKTRRAMHERFSAALAPYIKAEENGRKTVVALYVGDSGKAKAEMKAAKDARLSAQDVIPLALLSAETVSDAT